MAMASTGMVLLVVGAILMVLNTFFVGLRLYTRIFIMKALRFNDALLAVALGAFAALYALLVIGVQGGIGGHTFEATIPGISTSLKVIFFLEIIYVVLTSAMKGSIALTFIRLSRSRVLTLLFWVSIALDVLISAAFIIYLLVQCKPVSYAWRLLDPTAKGKCLPLTGQLYMGYALSIVTATLDGLLMISPWLMMRGRGLNSRLKLYIYGIFGLGILATIANIIRLVALVKLKGSTDQLLDAAPVFTWSAIEVSIGIIIAGLIELGPLAAKYGIKGFESYADTDERHLLAKPNDTSSIQEYEMNTGKM
ncbi:P-type ATPase [Colletotrichum tofieldiae]|uniref:P-type ATPase n=1 Tax=Colletotrichum tofieldiae TaxID=708197 RepID=A0A161VJ40_9PEZI|nr:P-type ATPase [Colletotrichum tofieldiae]GKT83442.1 P-type ATPase [Colletotrichum tofieldiae]